MKKGEAIMKIVYNNLVDRLILTVSQPVKGYFMP